MTTLVFAEDNNTINDTNPDEEVIENNNSYEDVNNQYDDLEENNESEIIYITEENYEEYSEYNYKNGSTIIINESLSNFNLNLEELYDIRIIGNENVTLNNSQIVVFLGNVSISNLTFNQDDSSEYLSSLEILTDNSTLENLTFNDNRTVMGRGTYNVVNIYGNNNKLLNCSFNTTYPAIRVRWITYFDQSKSTVVQLHGNNNTVLNNKLNIQESARELPYGLIIGISSYGNNTTIANNYIHMNGTLYMYGIRVVYHDNKVYNNTIIVLSHRYANGISLDGESSNNFVDNNDIYMETQNVTIDDQPLIDVSYGIIITEIRYKGGQYRSTNTKTINNKITNNKIWGNSSHVYGFEQFGGTNTEISNNIINVTGYMPMAIGIIGNNTQIINNILIAQGQSREIGDSADYIKPRTTAISDTYGSNTYISGNYFLVENGTIAGLDSAKNVTFESNSFNTNSEENFKLRGYSDYEIDDSTVHNIDRIIASRDIAEELSEDSSDYNMDDTKNDDDSNNNTSQNTDIPDNMENTNTTDHNMTIITDNETEKNHNSTEPIIITNNTDSNNNNTITNEENNTEDISHNTTEKEETQNNTEKEENKTNQTENKEDIKTSETDNTKPTPKPIPQNDTKTENITENQTQNTEVPPDITNITNNTELKNESIPINQTVITNSSANMGDEETQEEKEENNPLDPIEKTEIYEVHEKENKKDDSKSDTTTQQIGLTATIDKNTKAYEVTPNVVNKKIIDDSLKYLLTMIAIAIASIVYGYKRNDFN